MVNELPTLEITFLGTGTSGTVPSIACLTDPVNGCVCCRSTLPDSGVDGSRNIRRNTSIIVNRKIAGQPDKTILVDCGKSFYQSAISHFPRKGLRQIDAVILTHPHADAINGLDDLRSWTLRAAIQKSVDIYCDKSTYATIERAFPYLTSRAFATGGGDLPEINWHTIDFETPIDLFGIQITPLLLHHGKDFSTGKAFPNLGLKFGRDFVYIGDASDIPEASWSKIQANSAEEHDQLPVFIVDCLKLAPFASHFGIGQTVRDIVRVRAQRSYMLGFAHRVSHDCWTNACEKLSAKHFTTRKEEPAWPKGHKNTNAFERALLDAAPENIQDFEKTVSQEVSGWVDEDGSKGRQHWMRPAYDGLTITIRGNTVTDSDS